MSLLAGVPSSAAATQFVQQTVTQECADARVAAAVADERRAQAQERVRELRERVKKLKKRVKSFRAKIERAKAAGNTTRVQELRKRLKKVRGTLRKVRARLATARDRLAEATAARDAANAHAASVCAAPAPAPTFTTCADQVAVSASECGALLAVYAATNGPAWTDRRGWGTDPNVCAWYGVWCHPDDDAARNLVRGLFLDGNGLTGALPTEIADLPRLLTLQLSSNDLTAVPAEIGALAELRLLHLYWNNLTELPAELGNLASVEQLVLGGNQLTGDITGWAKPLSVTDTIKTLGLADGPGFNNCLTVADDAALEAWLTGHDPDWNECETDPDPGPGPDPDPDPTFCQEQTDVAEAECEALLAIFAATGGADWTDNTGWADSPEVCTWYGVWCHFDEDAEQILVRGLYLDGNGLTGSLPAQIADLPHLMLLQASGNALTTVPAEIGELAQLVWLHLYWNDLTELPDEVGDLANLKELILAGNQLTGDISGWAEPLSVIDAVDWLVLADGPGFNDCLTVGEDTDLQDWLDGHDEGWDECDGSEPAPGPDPIPFEDCVDVVDVSEAECEALVALYDATNGPDWRVNDGWLEGAAVCAWYGVWCQGDPESRSVWALSLDWNGLAGDLPAQLGDLSELEILSMGGNELTGVPEQIGDLPVLDTLHLYYNQLTSVPDTLGDLDTLVELTLGGNQLSGDLSGWAKPLSVADNLEALAVAPNGCLNAGGDQELDDWLTGHDDKWKSGCSSGGLIGDLIGILFP
ncbi:hypothetical protein [Nocardioides limicola]|uniref:hypothetical protein n=1 Tax=Nocardioides limicola TaxID=2803368 RepID=UPI00193BA238|nr:hypothetical protein [Nocardioides sp. DJM-14]